MIQGDYEQVAATQSKVTTPTFLLSRQAAAKSLAISVRQLDYLTAKGEIQAVRLGKRVLFLPEELQEFTRRLIAGQRNIERTLLPVDN